MRIASIVGARPQLIKAAVVSEALRRQHEEILVHTGQHYDATMSDIFFEQLELPSPDHHLGIGSGTHGAQTGRMLEALESVLLECRPDIVLIYGDTNSTLAGALAAVKLHLPVAHVEAGLRSFNRRMPEEINRVVADHLSAWLFCPTQTAVDNLAREGITRGVYLVGDVMYDLLRAIRARSPAADGVVQEMRAIRGGYHVATVHRAENTDDPERLRRILRGLAALSRPVLFPVHPRTRKAIEEAELWPLLEDSSVRCCEPLGYIAMVQLVEGAYSIVTDSGGLQKEAYLLGVPCVTVRDETEWLETLVDDWNVLASGGVDQIVAAAERGAPPTPPKPAFGDGAASDRIARLVESSA